MDSTKSVAEQIAGYLLDVEAVKLSPEEPFTWSSGWKSPIYCDNRITLSHPSIRTSIKSAMAHAIKQAFPQCTALVGVATAGIAIGALVADELGIPYAYCRPKPKAHGMKNQLEGQLDKKANVVVIEDLISTGGSSLKVVEYLRGEGHNVAGLSAIFTYGFQVSVNAFAEANCPFITLSNYESMLNEAESRGIIQQDQISVLEKWATSPDTWANS